MLCHLSALAIYVFPFGHLLAPFLIWQIKKHELPGIEAHAKEALNFQFSICIYLIVSGILVMAVIGIPLLILVGVFNLVCIVIASIKANDGVPWKYPLCIRFLK